MANDEEPAQSSNSQHQPEPDKEKNMEEGLPRNFVEPPPAPVVDSNEIVRWSFYRAIIAEFVATMFFLYVTLTALVGAHRAAGDGTSGIGILGTAWAFGGMIFVLVYCTAGISGGHINPAVTFGLCIARKVTIVRALFYIIAQCLGAMCGAALAKGVQGHYYEEFGGGVNLVQPGYSTGSALGAEILGTFILVYTVFSATDPQRSARDSHVPVLAPLPIGFSIFIVHLATIPITGTGINPARSLGAAVAHNHHNAWTQHWIFWVGPLVGATFAATYHTLVLKAGSGKFRNLLG